MPINNVKSPEVMYMKINDLTLQKPNINREKEVRSEKTTTSQKPETPARPEDRVQLSAKAIVENAKAKTANLPEVREEKVAQLREQIQSGTYQVSNRDLARAMIGTLLSEMA